MSRVSYFRLFIKNLKPATLPHNFRNLTVSSDQLNSIAKEPAKMTTSTDEIIERCKEYAAKKAVDDNINVSVLTIIRLFLTESNQLICSVCFTFSE